MSYALEHRPLIFFVLVLFHLATPVATHSVGLDEASCRAPCPDGKHDFHVEGFGIMYISLRSSLKWQTVEKEKLLGLTLSSKQEVGAVEISKDIYLKSAVTVCRKCRQATGMVFMTLAQLQHLASKHRELKPLLETALRTRP